MIIFGKLVGDKGYISKDLFANLFVNGIQLVTKVRNNMKNCLMSVADKLLLRKKASDSISYIVSLVNGFSAQIQPIRLTSSSLNP